jgi:phosphonate transport system permease protein
MSVNKRFHVKALVFDAICFTFLFFVAAFFTVKPDEAQKLNLKLNSLLALGFFIAGLMFSAGLIIMKKMTWGEHIFRPHYQRESGESVWYKSFWGWQAIFTLGTTFVVGLLVTHFSLYELTDKDGFDGAIRLFNGIINPDWTILPRAVINIIDTLFMAFIATALAIPFAFVLSFMCARNVMRSKPAFAVYLFLRTLFSIVRSVEALIWAIIFSVWVGIGPFAGMLALMVHSIASLAKQYSEMVESVLEGPIEGILSTGAGPFQVVRYAIVPQIILPYISFTVYRWDINVRMATIIGLVGGGGIGTLLIQYQGQAMWPQVGCIIVVIAVLVWLLDQASAHLREALK